MTFLSFSFFLIILILVIFFYVSKKEISDSLSSSVFECGFTSYYFSRFSFSMHYFTIGLIFLFLDLELCYLMPFFNSSLSDLKLNTFLLIFVILLVLGLIEEWKFQMLDWKF